MIGKWGRSLTTVAMVLLVSGSAFGFDGERKGFVMGLGLGVAPVVTYTNTDFGIDKSATAFTSHFMIGYSWNNKNLAAIEIHTASHEPGDWWEDVEFQSVIQGMMTVSWYHYYGSRGNSLFTSAGLGMYGFGFELNGSDHSDRGPGYLLGGGYEFAKQVQAGVYLLGAQSAVGGHVNGHTHVSFLLTVVAY